MQAFALLSPANVTRPRRVVPGASYRIVRHCDHRLFRLRPSPQTNAIYEYALAVAAEKTGVEVHAACVMSNHHELVVTDVRGVLPDFLRELHRSVAKAMNALHEDCENLWNAGKTEVEPITTAEIMEREIAAVVANPVDAGMVASPSEWPGINLWGEHDREVPRPIDYFSPDGKSPPFARLRITRPLNVGCHRVDASRLERTINDAILDARSRARFLGLTVLGRGRILSGTFIEQAKAYEGKRRLLQKLTPESHVVRREKIRARKRFLTAYRKALKAWQSGERDVVFPYGTWWMRTHHRAAVKGDDSSSARRLV